MVYQEVLGTKTEKILLQDYRSKIYLETIIWKSKNGIKRYYN